MLDSVFFVVKTFFCREREDFSDTFFSWEIF